MGGGGGTAQNYQASIPLAEIARQQYADYQQRFQPIEQDLIHQGTSDTQYLQAGTQAANSMNSAYQTQQGSMQRNMNRMGVTMTPQQQEAANQTLSLGQASSTVNAANTARGDVWDRINSVMSGGLSAADRTIRK